MTTRAKPANKMGLLNAIHGTTLELIQKQNDKYVFLSCSSCWDDVQSISRNTEKMEKKKESIGVDIELIELKY